MGSQCALPGRAAVCAGRTLSKTTMNKTTTPISLPSGLWLCFVAVSKANPYVDGDDDHARERERERETRANASVCFSVFISVVVVVAKTIKWPPDQRLGCSWFWLRTQTSVSSSTIIAPIGRRTLHLIYRFTQTMS